jgi:asparagine synthase (glutamine-hydrolysing)
MCGICGFVGEGRPDQLEAMMQLLRHRGPDAGGRFIDPATRVFLGHRRLSILDIEGGAQPMWNEDGQVGVVFNGEIYNFAELRRELTALGHRFASDHSDTEVIVHGFEEWGIDLPSHFNGMFAFAVLDRRQKVLFLARDRFGEKPLYYTAGEQFFAFASELRALGAHPRVDTHFDLRCVKKFLAYGYIPAPGALWRNTKKLIPGGYLHYDLRSHKLTTGTYWQFRVEPSAELARASEDDLAQELRHLLGQAVRRRLVSDVPLGVFLSGGIDSSAILSFASEVIPPSSLETYSIGFKESSFDESAYARTMAQQIGSQHHERILEMVDAQELLTSVLGRLDEPLGDPSILPTYLLSKFARERITVALSGDGGDELFAGYDPFQALYLTRVYSRLVPRWMHGGIRRLIDVLPVSSANMSLEFKLRRTLRGLSYPRPLWNSVWLGPLEPRELDDLLQEPVDVLDLYSEAITAWNDCRSDNLVDHTLEFYTRMYLSNDILVKADRASMLNSLEVRAPFLDNDLVEFARRLPASMKARRGHTKYLLKRALAPLLPAHVIRRKKKGFGIPLAAWLRDWPDVDVRNFVHDPGRDWLSPLNRDWICSRWDEHRQGRRDHRLFLWSILALMHHDAGELRPLARAA